MTNADLALILYEGAQGGNQLYLEKLRTAFDAGKKEWRIDELTREPVHFDFLWEHRDFGDAKANILKLATQGLIPMIEEITTAINVHGLKVRIKHTAGIYVFRAELPGVQAAWRRGAASLDATKQMARQIDPDVTVDFIVEEDAET